MEFLNTESHYNIGECLMQCVSQTAQSEVKPCVAGQPDFAGGEAGSSVTVRTRNKYSSLLVFQY